MSEIRAEGRGRYDGDSRVGESARQESKMTRQRFRKLQQDSCQAEGSCASRPTGLCEAQLLLDLFLSCLIQKPVKISVITAGCVV